MFSLEIPAHTAQIRPENPQQRNDCQAGRLPRCDQPVGQTMCCHILLCQKDPEAKKAGKLEKNQRCGHRAFLGYAPNF